ncbi:MAG: GDYXXLXY domain-containing protein [Acidobacteriota bacterium]
MAQVAFTVAVVVQIAILTAIPARKAMTRMTGRSVVLKVQPVDPYSILSGYYVTLGFEISRLDAFPGAPSLTEGETCYAVIERGEEDGIWRPFSLERVMPSDLPENRAVVAGRMESGQLIKYGIESFFIPESKRNVIAEDLRKNRDRARVAVKLDSAGHAALVKLMIEDRIYQ